MGMLTRIRCRRREAEYEKYQILLLTYKIRLRDMPRRLLEGEYTFSYHLYAFRADRISKDLYDSDLCFVKEEIVRAEISKNWHLQQLLKHLLEEKMFERESLFQLE